MNKKNIKQYIKIKKLYKNKTVSDMNEGIKKGYFHILFYDEFGPGVGPCCGGHYTSVFYFKDFFHFLGFARFVLLNYHLNELEECECDEHIKEKNKIKNAFIKLDEFLKEENFSKNKIKKIINFLNKILKSQCHRFTIIKYGGISDILKNRLICEIIGREKYFIEIIKLARKNKFDENNKKHFTIAKKAIHELIDNNG